MDNVEPSAEVLVEDVWHPAQVLGWSLAASDWWANVRWWPAPGDGELGTFPASEVRDGDSHGLHL